MYRILEFVKNSASLIVNFSHFFYFLGFIPCVSFPPLSEWDLERKEQESCVFRLFTCLNPEQGVHFWLLSGFNSGISIWKLFILGLGIHSALFKPHWGEVEKVHGSRKQSVATDYIVTSIVLQIGREYFNRIHVSMYTTRLWVYI